MQLDNNNHRNPRCTKPDEAAFALLGKMTSKSAILAVLLTFEAFAYTYSENIVRHACNSQATFFKVATNYSMNDNGKVTKTTSNSLIGCVDLCFQYPLCKAFNYKSVTTEESTCELLQKDRITSPNDIVPRGGWSFYDTGLFSTQVSSNQRLILILKSVCSSIKVMFAIESNVNGFFCRLVNFAAI